MRNSKKLLSLALSLAMALSLLPGGAMAAGEVALAGYWGVMRNRAVIVPGLRNRILRLAPVGVKMDAVGRVKQRQIRKREGA